ncbi:transcription factor E2F7 isoform X2 [Betta splendens]|uniref:Transcription factor E2F7 n=1 Tax=Betta splendens TaxID=158456 RepID=A0A6P7NR13_BETSP|nr:transcription factor E2F7 isoform X2 [Betta splendens]
MEVECLALKDLSSPRTSFMLEPHEDGVQSEQKENICADRRRSTPMKSDPAPPALLINRRGATPDLAHITPVKHTPLAEPLTPTANLKLLISAASPDIRDREMKKVLFRPIENESDQLLSPDTIEEESEDSCQFEAAGEEDNTEKKPSRKQKSLGLLCQKFLALYPDYPEPHTAIWISLDEVSTSLGVERRRIYDIVNVLESLTIVGRIAKNSYTWYGRQQLEATLEGLQQKGRQRGYHLQMELATEKTEAALGHEDDLGEGDIGNAGVNRKDKSLRIMSQKFVMLFLVSKTQTVTLDAAAKVLIEESQDSSSHSKYKTKVRRLYDIANVLTSLGLIRKVHVREERGRKPAFKWLGPVEFHNSRSNTVTAAVVSCPKALHQMADAGKSKMARHASFSITPTSAAVQRQVCSAPSSPQREQTGLLNQPVDYSRRTPSNSAVCRLQFGSVADNQASTALPTHPSSRSSPFSSSSTQSTHLAPSLPSSHCLAYLPSLSQPSLVMMYRPDQTSEGQSSPKHESEEWRKRRREGSEDNDISVKRKGTCGIKESVEATAEPQMEGESCSQLDSTRASPTRPSGSVDGVVASDSTQPSHAYLYVPNNGGLSSLNFLLPAGQPTLSPSNVPTLAVPCMLVPSAALSHYPLVAGGLPQQGSDAQAKLSFSLSTMMSPAHFTMGMTPYTLTGASEMSWPSVPSPSTPKQSRPYRSTTGALHSPPFNTKTPEPPTPHTPNETMASATKAFFQTPGAVGGIVSTAPATRRRGSAQRRLNIGHPPNSWTI